MVNRSLVNPRFPRTYEHTHSDFRVWVRDEGDIAKAVLDLRREIFEVLPQIYQRAQQASTKRTSSVAAALRPAGANGGRSSPRAAAVGWGRSPIGAFYLTAEWRRRILHSNAKRRAKGRP